MGLNVVKLLLPSREELLNALVTEATPFVVKIAVAWSIGLQFEPIA